MDTSRLNDRLVAPLGPVCVILLYMRFAALHVGSMKVFVFLAFRFETFLISCRGVQHLWRTARNEAIARGGQGSRTLDPVPAKKLGP